MWWRPAMSLGCWIGLPNSGGRQRRGPDGAIRSSSFRRPGYDGFWIHRVLQAEGIESHVVNAALIATSRRRRRAKTDGIDGRRADPGVAGLQARRATGVRDGPGADAGGRRPSPHLA